ncbi:MAG: ATP-dependent zinc metalloprotease FtsH [Clostridiales bacterium]|nr:ATP-dependent zinc metalloprotease FtsH [Clostridiales bacterium]
MLNDNKKPNRRNPIIYLIIGVIVVALLNGFFFSRLFNSNTSREVPYNVFLAELEAQNIHQVEVNESTIYFSLHDATAYKEDENYRFAPSLYGEPEIILYCVRMDDPDLVDRLYAAGAEFAQVEPSTMPYILQLLISAVLPLVLFFFVFRLMTKKLGAGGGNVMSFGKSGAKIYAKDQTGTTFADVAGQEEAKESLLEIVDFLHDPMKYEEIGAKLPKGALLVGPPGTGKTLLAKAVAGEANVPFFSISGSEFVEMFVGMGAAKVRDLFKQANEKAPCIVFIDEIDTIGKKRDGQGYSGNDEREQTLNQLLAEMDGFDGKKGVVILAATNRPDSLDKALLRPGRFDRRIPVELPDLRGREAILRVHAKKVRMDDSVEFSSVARATPGASGAELANIINEAALRAVRQGRRFVSQQDLEESVDVILAGQQRKGAVISQHDKEVIAYHEVGHAITAAMQTHSAPVTKITIIPRTSGALGFTMQVEEDEKVLMTQEEAYSKIVTYTGGRVAEELIFGSITSGASNDIEQATKLSRAMITRYGMSQRFGMVALETVTNQYLGGDTSLTCSTETATLIDQEVINMVQSAHDRAVEILRANMAKLNQIAQYLIERETITGDEFMEILNEPVALPVAEDEE